MNSVDYLNLIISYLFDSYLTSLILCAEFVRRRELPRVLSSVGSAQVQLSARRAGQSR